MDWVNAVVQGVLVGGLYALFAAGLSLIFGVMRLVNIAHGDLIVLAAYVALVAMQTTGLDPLLSLLIVVPVMAVFGYALQRIILNGLLTLFTADTRRLRSGALEVSSFPIGGGIDIGVLPLLMFCTAVAVIAILQFIFYTTPLGRAFRATSDDPEVARMMGVDNRHVFGLAMALSLAVVAIAG